MLHSIANHFRSKGHFHTSALKNDLKLKLPRICLPGIPESQIPVRLLIKTSHFEVTGNFQTSAKIDLTFELKDMYKVKSTL